MSQSNEPTPVEATKVSLSFEVKIGLPNYSNIVARAFVERRVTEGLTEEGELSVAYSLARAAVDEALYDFGGIESVVPQTKAVKTNRDGTETPLADSEVERLAAAFGGATVEPQAPSAPVSVGAIKIKGKQHGEIPAWLIDDAAAAGVSEVWDNRDGLDENPKRPWFKATQGGKAAKAFWPPKGAA